MELHKAYGSLDRYRLLDILEGYVVGPRASRIVCEYWDKIWMVARMGGYYGSTFKGFRGMM